MAEQRLRLRLGAFVAVTLLTLSALVIMFGSAPTFFANKLKYTVVYPEAPGIGTGTPIRKSGVRIGEVTKLDLDPRTGQVRVLIAVDPKYPPRTGEEATISRGLLNGDTAIDFLPRIGPDGQPQPSGDDYPPGSEIVGVPPITPRSLLTPATGVIASAQMSLELMVSSFERLEKVSPQLERTLLEFENLARDIRQFVPELKKTNNAVQKLIGVAPGNLPPGAVLAQADGDPNNLRELIKEARVLLNSIRPAVEDLRGAVRRTEPELTAAVKSARTTFDQATVTLNSVNEVLSPENRKQVDELLKTLNAVGTNILKISAGFQTMLTEAEQAVKNFDRRTAATADVLADLRAITRPLAARSDVLVKDVAESAGQLNKILTEIRELVRAFARENGTVQKLLTESSLYHSLDAAAASLSRVLARAEKITEDLSTFADKVARRPEIIGLGGAVHPSSGLKGSPFAPTPVPPDMRSYRPDWPPAIPARPAPIPAQPAPVMPERTVEGMPLQP
jgi:phospholipid/cholesterol/gamma-HCH transport system substrate-binding protein